MSTQFVFLLTWLIRLIKVLTPGKYFYLIKKCENCSAKRSSTNVHIQDRNLNVCEPPSCFI